MEKSKVKVEFCISGDDFDPQEITEKLSIIPNIVYKQGDPIKNRPLKRRCSCWQIETDYEESLDAEEQLEKIISKLYPKKEQLQKLHNTYIVNMMFMFVLIIENSQIPSSNFSKEFIEFVASIGAEIQFDNYVYSCAKVDEDGFVIS